METVLQIAAVCLVGAVLAAVLRQRSPEAALLLAVAAALLWGFAAGRRAASCRLSELEFPYGGYNGRVG